MNSRISHGDGQCVYGGPWKRASNNLLITSAQHWVDPLRVPVNRRQRKPRGSSTVRPMDRSTKAGQSTVTPPTEPPPLPVTAFSTAGSGQNLPREAGRFSEVRQSANQKTRSIWQRPIVLIGAALLLLLCLGAFACYLTIQQLVHLAAENGRQEQVVDKHETPVPKPVEPEKQQASVAQTLTVPGQYATIQSAIDAAKPGRHRVG